MEQVALFDQHSYSDLKILLSDMFATINIVLPSLFGGGAAHRTYGNKSHIGGLISTPQILFLAWHMDVMYEVKPIMCGQRLALSYNLIRSTSSPNPLPALSRILRLSYSY